MERLGIRSLLAACVLLSSLPATRAAELSASFEQASPAAFGRPHDLVLGPEGRRLYVADLGKDRVAVLDPWSLKLLGSIGADTLSSPHDVAFDRAGRLLVADTGNDRIAVFSAAGEDWRLTAEWHEGLSGPEGVAEGPDGLVYVANARGSDVVALRDGKLVHQLGKSGSALGEFRRPHDIAFDGAKVYAADPGNNRIQVLDRDLAPLSALGGEAYNFREPKYFDLDPRGWLVVADEYNHKVKLLDPEQKIALVIGSGVTGKGPNRFNYPEGAELSGQDLWISDTRNHRIVRYKISGLP